MKQAVIEYLRAPAKRPPTLPDRLLLESYTVSDIGLRVMRVAVALYILTGFLPLGLWLPDLPQNFHVPPPGLPRRFDTFPGAATVIALNATAVVCCVLLLLNRLVAVAGFALTGALMLLNAFAFSTGKIDHNILLVLMPSFLSLSAINQWGRGESFDAGERRGSWAMTWLAMVIAMAMFIAAWEKHRSGWLDFDTPASLGHLSTNFYALGRYTFFGELVVSIHSWAFWEFSDWVTVLFEYLVFAAFFWPKGFRWMLFVACCFHFAVLLIYDIPFSINVMAYAAFLPWERLVRRIPDKFSVSRGKLGWVVTGVGVLIFAGAYASGGSLVQPWLSTVIVTLGVVMPIVVVIKDRWPKRKTPPPAIDVAAPPMQLTP